jgi:hypothetical protein
VIYAKISYELILQNKFTESIIMPTQKDEQFHMVHAVLDNRMDVEAETIRFMQRLKSRSRPLQFIIARR